MAVYKSRQVNKKHTNRGIVALADSDIGGYIVLPASLGTGDSLQMIRMGENMRPTQIMVRVRNKDGALSLSTTSFTCGVEPIKATNFTRADGKVFTPLTASPALYGTVALATDGMATLNELPPPRATPGYAPYYITLTPSAAIVATGSHELYLSVTIQGEEDADAPAFTSFP